MIIAFSRSLKVRSPCKMQTESIALAASSPTSYTPLASVIWSVLFRDKLFQWHSVNKCCLSVQQIVTLQVRVSSLLDIVPLGWCHLGKTECHLTTCLDHLALGPRRSLSRKMSNGRWAPPQTLFTFFWEIKIDIAHPFWPGFEKKSI